MKVIIMFCLLFLYGFAYTQNRSVFFENSSFEQVLQKAKKENKLVFLDTYTAWCSACKWMDKTTFNQDSVADFFNSNFVNIKIDTEKGEGPEIKKRYPGIVSYPTYFILDTDGKELHRIQGGGRPNMFITKVKAGLNPETRIPSLAKRYEVEKHSYNSFICYLGGLKLAGLYQASKQLASDYLQGLGDNAADTSNWFLFCEYFCYAPFCKEFELLLNRKSEFIKHNGVEQVNGKINMGLLWGAQEMLHRDKKNNIEAWEKLYLMATDQKTIDSELILIYLELVKVKRENSVSRLICVIEEDLVPSSIDGHQKLNLFEYFAPMVNVYGTVVEKITWEKALNMMIKNVSGEKDKEGFQKLLEKIDKVQ